MVLDDLIDGWTETDWTQFWAIKVMVDGRAPNCNLGVSYFCGFHVTLAV
jgi:hypothetical protein